MENEYNNIYGGFNEMNQEDLEGEEYPDEEQINQAINEDGGNGEGEIKLLNNEQNKKRELFKNFGEKGNNQNGYQENKNKNINNKFVSEKNIKSNEDNQKKIDKRKLELLKEEIENITDSEIDEAYKEIEQSINNKDKKVYPEKNNNYINQSSHDLEVENIFLK